MLLFRLYRPRVGCRSSFRFSCSVFSGQTVWQHFWSCSPTSYSNFRRSSCQVRRHSFCSPTSSSVVPVADSAVLASVVLPLLAVCFGVETLLCRLSVPETTVNDVCMLAQSLSYASGARLRLEYHDLLSLFEFLDNGDGVAKLQ